MTPKEFLQTRSETSLVSEEIKFGEEDLSNGPVYRKIPCTQPRPVGKLRDYHTIVSVGRSVVLDIGGVRATEDHKRGAAVIVSVRRRVVFDVGGVRATENNKRQATAIVSVGRSVVLDVSRIRTTLNFWSQGIPETAHRMS